MSKQSADVIVVGAGLAGLCAAHYLNEAGRSVTVIERREGVALETSFANAGMATPSMSDPWNAPGVHWDLLRYLGRDDAPLLLRPGAILGYLGWGLRFLRFSSPGRFDQAMRANFALSSYSVSEIRALRESLGLEYEQRSNGTLKVFRKSRSFDAAVADSEKLAEHGLGYTVMAPAQALAFEPLLQANGDEIVGAIHYPDDETGDAHLFCRALHRALAARGVAFEFNTTATGIRVKGGSLAGLACGTVEWDCQSLVVANAGWAPRLLDGIGVRLPIRPVKGYSVTVPIDDRDLIPACSIIDSDLHAAVTPFDQRIRMAGTAELAGWNARLDPARLRALWTLAETINPHMAAAADRSQARNWCGFRPMSADGNPYIGATPVTGLFVNCGHGYLGWTQSAGSGRLLADLMAGEAPGIDPVPYRVGRP